MIGTIVFWIVTAYVAFIIAGRIEFAIWRWRHRDFIARENKRMAAEEEQTRQL